MPGSPVASHAHDVAPPPHASREIHAVVAYCVDGRLEVLRAYCEGEALDGADAPLSDESAATCARRAHQRYARLAPHLAQVLHVRYARLVIAE